MNNYLFPKIKNHRRYLPLTLWAMLYKTRSSKLTRSVLQRCFGWWDSSGWQRWEVQHESMQTGRTVSYSTCWRGRVRTTQIQRCRDRMRRTGDRWLTLSSSPVHQQTIKVISSVQQFIGYYIMFHKCSELVGGKEFTMVHFFTK